MRLVPSGRAGSFQHRRSTFMHWRFDEQTAPSTDVVRGVLLTGSSGLLPGVVRSPLGHARRFGGLDAQLLQADDGDVSSIVLRGDWTIAVRFRMHTYTGVFGAALSTLVAFAVADDEVGTSSSIDDLSHVVIAITEDGAVRVSWGAEGDPDVVCESPVCIRPYLWHTLHVRKRDTSTSEGVPVDGPGGTTVLDIYVGGERIHSEALANTHGGGANCIWQVGSILESAGGTGDPVVNEAFADIDEVAIYDEPLTVDEMREDVKRYTGFSLLSGCEAKVLIEKAGGEAVDMTDLYGVDFVDEVTITDDPDAPTLIGQARLQLDQGDLSIASLRTDTRVNLTDQGDPDSFSPLIQEGARLEVLLAAPPLGVPADGRDWDTQLKGRIDEVDENADEMTIHFRDQGGDLLLVYSETELDYGGEPPIAIEASMQEHLDNNDNDNTNDFAPGLNERVGSYDPVMLLVPNESAFNTLPFTARREAVLTALRSWGSQIAWDVKYRNLGDPFRQGFHLYFYDPLRDILVPQAVIGPDEVFGEYPSTKSRLPKRTNVRVTYQSSEETAPSMPTPPSGYSIVESTWTGVDGQGNRLPASIHLQSDQALADTRAIRQFMEIPEIAGGQIDTITEAYRWALGMLQDLEESDIGTEVRLFARPGLMVNSQVFLPRIKNRFTAAQRLTVARSTLTVREAADVTVALRGKPTVGFKRWLALDTRTGKKPGVIDPSNALVDSKGGSMIEAVKMLLDRTNYLGGALNVRNGLFSDWTSGVQLPPDGWSLAEGDWNTDAEESSTSQSGGHSVRFNTNDALLASDWIPVDGQPESVYGIEVTYQQESGSLDSGLDVQILWYDASKTLIGASAHAVPPEDAVVVSGTPFSRTSNVATLVDASLWGVVDGDMIDIVTYYDQVTGTRTANLAGFITRKTVVDVVSDEILYANVGANVTTNNAISAIRIRPRSYEAPTPAAVATWEDGVNEGFEPPGPAAFARIFVRKTGTNPVLLDRVVLRRVGQELQVWPVFLTAPTTGSWRSFAVGTFPGFDYEYGNSLLWVDGTSVATDVDVGYYVAKRNQTLHISGQLNLERTSGASSANVKLRVKVNETYTIGHDGTPNNVGEVRHITGYALSGTGGLDSDEHVIPINVTIPLIKKGDRVSIEIYNVSTSTWTAPATPVAGSHSRIVFREVIGN